MIKFINEETFNILLFFIIYALVIVMIGFIREVKLRYRSRINFKRFLKIRKSYQFIINKVYVSLIILFISSSTYFSVIILRNPVYSVYIIVMELLNILVFIILLLHISSIKYNKNLAVFSNYHSIITKSFENKELLLGQIKNLEAIHKSLIAECNVLNNDLSKYFMNYTGIDNLMSTIFPISEIIKSYQDQTNNFDNDIIHKFDLALKNYLNTGQHSSIVISEFKFVDNLSIKTSLDTIANEQKQAIHKFSFSKLKDNQIASNEQLINLIAKLVELKIPLNDEFIIGIMDYISGSFPYKKKILSTLSEQKLLSVAVLCNYIHVKDWSWVYDMPLINLISQNDALMVFTSIIHCNASNCAYKILTTLDTKFYSSLKKSVIEESTDNETRKMFIIFSKVLNSDDYINSKSVKYENIAIILSHYYEDYYQNDNNALKIKDIVKYQTFEENAKYIEELYKRIKDGYQDLFLKTIKTLFIYSNSSYSTNEFINYEKILNQYSEYRKNLNINELNILDLLIKVLILTNEFDKFKIDTIYQMFDESVFKRYLSGLSKKDLQYDLRIIVSKTIIKNLTIKNNIKTLKRVINRIENGRVVLDKVVNI